MIEMQRNATKDTREKSENINEGRRFDWNLKRDKNVYESVRANKLTLVNLWAAIDIWLYVVPVSIDKRPMATYVRDVFGILAEIDVYQREFHAAVPIAVYFGNRTNKADRMYRAAHIQQEKRNKIKILIR